MFEENNRILVILSKRNCPKVEDVEPLIVGGLDLTDIPEFNHLLTKKNYALPRNLDLPMIPGAANEPSMQQQPARMQ